MNDEDIRKIVKQMKADEIKFICIKCSKYYYIFCGEFVSGEHECECGGEIIKEIK